MKIMEYNEVSENELNVLSILNHVNIVKYYQHFMFSTRNYNIKNQNMLVIITEFCEVFILILRQFSFFSLFFFFL